MCYYRLYIFLGCGHSTFSSTPVRYCSNARIGSPSVERRRWKSPESEALSSAQSTASSKTSSVDSSLSHVLQLDSATTASTDTQPTQPAAEENEETTTSTVKSLAKEENRMPCAEGRAHPFHIVKLERICAVCEYERDQRLRVLDSSINEIKFEAWRWRLKYQGGPPTPLLQRSDHTKAVDTAEGEIKRASGVWRMSAAVGNWVRDWQQKGTVIE